MNIRKLLKIYTVLWKGQEQANTAYRLIIVMNPDSLCSSVFACAWFVGSLFFVVHQFFYRTYIILCSLFLCFVIQPIFCFIQYIGPI